MKLKTLLTTLGLTAAISTAASAQIYNVDFGLGFQDDGTPDTTSQGDGVGPTTQAYGVFNQTTLGTFNNSGQQGEYGRRFELHDGTTTYSQDTLVDSTGATSGVNFTNDDLGPSTSFQFNNGGNGNGYEQGGTGTNPAVVFEEYEGLNNTTPLSFTLTGLTANGLYNLALYSVVENTGGGLVASLGTGPTYTLQSGLVNTGFSSVATTPVSLGDLSFVGNYVVLSGNATSTGTLTFSVEGLSGTNENELQGFSLEGVAITTPEPSSLALMLAGLVAVGFFAFRRSKIQA